jgi:hypothetical protein
VLKISEKLRQSKNILEEGVFMDRVKINNNSNNNKIMQKIKAVILLVKEKEVKKEVW